MQAVLPKTGSDLLTLLGKSAQTDPAKLLAWSNLATPTLCHLRSPVTLRTWQSFFATFCPTFQSPPLSLMQLRGYWETNCKRSLVNPPSQEHAAEADTAKKDRK